ncbi:MAG: class I SAM-dependent DNA methyltransferase [Terracidiphilus sp.]
MTERDRIDGIRADYDRIAREYARRLYNELKDKPLDCDLLRRFAAATGGRGTVCDMGCGPGHVARLLRDSGAEVFGLDLSPGMIAEARRLNPDIDFREGNMLALPLNDGELAGIAAFYAIVNLPVELLPTAFDGMHRALAPGGLLLLAFHAGDEVIRPGERFGQAISMEFFCFPQVVVRTLLVQAGFEIEEVVERGPYAPEVEFQSNRSYIFARKPGQTPGE